MTAHRIITPAQRAARAKGLPWQGLGDVVAAATKSIGIKPCAGCKRRQSVLNQMVPFTTRPSPRLLN